MADIGRVTEIVKEKMRSVSDRVSRSLSGEFFHVLGEQGLIRLRVDGEGRISYDRSLSQLPGQVINTVKDRLEVTRQEGQKSWRRVVTGNSETRIRDYIKGVPQVKFIDKLSFMFGVTCIVLTEFLALREPQWFTMFHMTLMALLLAYRLQDYQAQKYHLFMLDFCYFMNLSVIIQTSLYPDDLLWFKTNYVLCMGTLMSAIVMWQNSLVFHSLDKLTSFFLHFFPPLHLHLFRWGFIPSSSIHREDALDLQSGLVYPFLLYCIWQVSYSIITEVLLRRSLQADPQLVTSIRYLSMDKKNAMHKMTKKACKSLGIFHREETFDAGSAKTKLIFVVTQVLYTMLTLIPTPLFYSSYRLSFVYFICIFLWATWRGASYYIEVFSERYNLKFVKMELEKSLPGTNQGATQNSEDEEEEREADREADQELIKEIVEAIYAAQGNESPEVTTTEAKMIPLVPNSSISSTEGESTKLPEGGSTGSAEGGSSSLAGSGSTCSDLSEGGEEERSWEELSTPL